MPSLSGAGPRGPWHISRARVCAAGLLLGQRGTGCLHCSSCHSGRDLVVGRSGREQLLQERFATVFVDFDRDAHTAGRKLERGSTPSCVAHEAVVSSRDACSDGVPVVSSRSSVCAVVGAHGLPTGRAARVRLRCWRRAVDRGPTRSRLDGHDGVTEPAGRGPAQAPGGSARRRVSIPAERSPGRPGRPTGVAPSTGGRRGRLRLGTGDRAVLLELLHPTLRSTARPCAWLVAAVGSLSGKSSLLRRAAAPLAGRRRTGPRADRYDRAAPHPHWPPAWPTRPHERGHNHVAAARVEGVLDRRREAGPPRPGWQPDWPERDGQQASLVVIDQDEEGLITVSGTREQQSSPALLAGRSARHRVWVVATGPSSSWTPPGARRARRGDRTTPSWCEAARAPAREVIAGGPAMDLQAGVGERMVETPPAGTRCAVGLHTAGDAERAGPDGRMDWRVRRRGRCGSVSSRHGTALRRALPVVGSAPTVVPTLLKRSPSTGGGETTRRGCSCDALGDEERAVVDRSSMPVLVSQTRPPPQPGVGRSPELTWGSRARGHGCGSGLRAGAVAADRFDLQVRYGTGTHAVEWESTATATSHTVAARRATRAIGGVGRAPSASWDRSRSQLPAGSRGAGRGASWRTTALETGGCA
jgi:hypothetical protein